jgi:hypothetical protein
LADSQAEVVAMKQMVEGRSMKNIPEVGVEAGSVENIHEVEIEAGRVMMIRR